MLGLHFAEELIASKKAAEEERVNLFMKFEQLVAYSRYAAGAEDDDGADSLGSRG